MNNFINLVKNVIVGEIMIERRPHRRWTKEEDDFLKNNFRVMSIREIASCLGCNRFRVSNRMRWLHLQKSPTPRRYTQEELQKVRLEFLKGTRVEDIANLIGRTENAVTDMAYNVLKLTRPVTLKVPGAYAEILAKDYLEAHGFQIVERGTWECAYDWLAEKAGKRYAINVKAHTLHLSISINNLLRLIKFGIPAFLWYRDNSWYLLVMEEDEE
jgi:hypothetical protein